MTEETKQLLALLKAELESAEQSTKDETEGGSAYNYWSGFMDGVGHAISVIKKSSRP